MTVRIDKKIVGYQVTGKEESPEAAQTPVAESAPAEEPQDKVVQLHEKLQRPEMLIGSTYKVKTPLSEHALYVTINDIVLNHGTDHELRRPFEIFINSKNMDHFQWIVALTRVISAVFRKGGDCTFLVEELKAVFDPQGGYFKSGGRFMPSLVAEIGWAIEDHLQNIGLLEAPGLTDHQKKILDEKKAEYTAKTGDDGAGGDFPTSAELCRKCSVKASILLDGCMTCLHCGDSNCG